MNTYIDFKNTQDLTNIQTAAESIKQGKLVLFPTETVYGIGANGLNKEAVKNIFIAKGRKQDNPLILHVSSIDMINKIAKNISELEYKLISTFFPGPFTIVLERKDIVPDIVTGGLNTVGIRMPSNEIALKLIELSDTPIAAPSANISGKPSGTNINDIFNESIDLFNNYYKYDLNNVKKIFDPISFPTIDQKSLSSFILDNTVISAGKLDFLKKDSSLLSNDVKWQLIPYPSSNYDNYKSYVDGFNQLGFTIVGDYNYNGEDVSSFNEEFTREIAFEILYDLFDGYYHKFPIAQENNIKEYLEKHLTKESIDLFFKFNRNVSFEATNVLSTLYSASSYGKEHYDNNQIEKLFSSASVSLDSFLLMNESFIETYFLKNLSYNNHVVLNNKFNYTLKVKYENNYYEMSIHELYEELYDGLMKSNR